MPNGLETGKENPVNDQANSVRSGLKEDSV